MRFYKILSYFEIIFGCLICFMNRDPILCTIGITHCLTGILILFHFFEGKDKALLIRVFIFLIALCIVGLIHRSGWVLLAFITDITGMIHYIKSE